jgi:hypothetical protein
VAAVSVVIVLEAKELSLQIEPAPEQQLVKELAVTLDAYQYSHVIDS